MNYRELINKGAYILKDCKIITASLDAELLFSFVLNQTREKILLNLEKEINLEEDGLLTLSFDRQTDFFRPGHKTWTLPEDIDVENITAECKDGLLTVTLPKIKRLPSSRKVEIL